MGKYFSAIFIIFFSFLYSGSHWNEEQVVEYVHHSEYQRRASWHLLSQIKFNRHENVLDVGCGDGRNSACLAWLIRKGNVIGIDPSQAMIAWAKKQYHPLEFPNLSFMEGDANTLPKKMFDVITCFFSLHVVKDKQSAIEGFFDHLSDEGIVIAVIPPKNSEWLESIRETISDSLWQPYFKDFHSTFLFEELQDYVNYFENAGFSVIHTEHTSSVDPFVNREEAINWFHGTWPHIHYLPKELRREFISNIIDRYAEKRPGVCSEDGTICFYFGNFEIVAKKRYPGD